MPRSASLVSFFRGNQIGCSNCVLIERDEAVRKVVLSKAEKTSIKAAPVPFF